MKSCWYGFRLLLVFVVGSLASAQSLPAPTNLTAHLQLGDEGARIVLMWQSAGMSDRLASVNDGSSFAVFRSVDDTSHFQMRTNDGVSETSFSDRDIMPGHTYYYYVESIQSQDGSQSMSGPSNIASVAYLSGVASGPHGAIEGTVTDSVTGKPLVGVLVAFYRVTSDEDRDNHTWTDSMGHYHATLDSGSYLVRAKAFGVEMESWVMMSIPVGLYATEWYDDATDAAHATPVHVGDSTSFTADFDLHPIVPPMEVSINGTVTDTAGSPLAGASVVFSRTMGETEEMDGSDGDHSGWHSEDMDIEGFGQWEGGLWRGKTDSMGHYTAHIITGRTYTAFAFKQGYLPQFYKDEQDPRNADPIVVSGDTSGFDFSLAPKPVYANSVSGMVHDSSGAGVGARVILLSVPKGSEHETGRFVSTDSTGSYSIANIPPGTYFVFVVPFSHYSPAFYKANECGVREWQMADTVTVSATSNLTGLDVCVNPFAGSGMGHVDGKVASTTGPLPGVNVFALNASGAAVGYSVSDAMGGYSLANLPPGNLTVLADQPGYRMAEGSVLLAAGQSSAGPVFLSLNAVPTSVNPGSTLPGAYTLGQNYPNPFNPTTEIQYALPAPSSVQLIVYNLLGQEVARLANGVEAAGTHSVRWDGRDRAGHSVASGIYLYRLHAVGLAGGGTFSSVHKMVVLR